MREPALQMPKERAGGAPGVGAEVHLQPLVEQAVPLQPMGPMAEQVSMLQQGAPWYSPVWSCS